MSTLSKEFRRQLERTVLAAREEAERGAEAALEAFGVAEAKAPGHLGDAGKVLRRKLRAHGRQVGDVRRPDESQQVEHLVHECAYEHWHRMLFARFLAENGFLIEPESGLDVDFAYCEDEGKRLGIDPWELASRFAQRMLPEIFRPDDPVLQLRLPAESCNRLTVLLTSLPREVFLADDSLGWVYQFWQVKKKEDINDAEIPIGADELAPVTQLFTEDYIVEFLLHNTLGAWWTSRLAAVNDNRFSVESCPTEEAARKASALTGVDWKYLRFVQKDGKWVPAAGTFEGWPNTVKELRVLDPCMGSGHFLVFALIILVWMRMEEEGLSAPDACVAVLRENLFGLELDPRCTQIAAFNLALAAWKLGGHQAELPLNLACSGLGLHAKKEDWLKLAERAAQTSALAAESDLLGAREETLLSQKLKAGMERLYQLFQKAPVLGSLINPRALGGDLLVAEFHDLQPLLAKALQRETGDEAHELAVTAEGVTKAAEILACQFTLVATNVPYLGRGKQHDLLKNYLDRVYPTSKWDLATAFIERCELLCEENGTAALVTPQQWCFGDKYISFRDSEIRRRSWQFLARLGTNAFETISGEVVNVILYLVSPARPQPDRLVKAIDVSGLGTPQEKQTAMLSCELLSFSQLEQLKNPDYRVTLRDPTTQKLLGSVVKSTEGLSAGDGERFILKFWELQHGDPRWAFLQSAPAETKLYCGITDVVLWEDGSGEMARSDAARVRGHSAWRKPGIVVAKMNSVRASVYLGGLFAKNCAVLSVANAGACPAVLEFVTSAGFENEIARLDANLNTATSVFEKVPFDLARWLMKIFFFALIIFIPPPQVLPSAWRPASSLVPRATPSRPPPSAVCRSSASHIASWAREALRPCAPRSGIAPSTLPPCRSNSTLASAGAPTAVAHLSPLPDPARTKCLLRS
jgi:hypothetical protein